MRPRMVSAACKLGAPAARGVSPMHGHARALIKPGEQRKYDPSKKDTSLRERGCPLFLVRGWRVRRVLYLAAFTHRADGTEYVFPRLDRSRPGSGVHRQQAREQERRG